MAPIQIDRVISVNSEDAAFPATNLLNNNNNKWKCKIGENQATIVLQLKEPTLINAIDVGNAHSAFIEVLVGKCSSPNKNFQVLLTTSTLMSVRDSKYGNNVNGVTFFRNSDLLKPIVDEKWDQIKIVCTQPFNKHVKYGLSFIVFHGLVNKNNEESTLGHFNLKKVESDSNIRAGRWFTKRKELEKAVTPLTAAAAIREASTPTGISLAKHKKITKAGTPLNGKTKDKKKKQILEMMGREEEDQDDSDKDPDYQVESEGSEYDLSYDWEDSPNVKRKPVLHKLNANKLLDIPSTSTSNTRRTPKRMSNNMRSHKKTKKCKMDVPPRIIKPQKPFNMLMKDVTLVISGYKNPLRGSLQSKAMSMGSKYKKDWDNTCTHLVCAFPNTPKFNQVRGKGKIVKKDWVEDCHDQRKRLPWRRYALDLNDQEKPESEEEIFEETSDKNAHIFELGIRRRTVSDGSDGSVTEDEIEGYALDLNDQGKPESEEEICEETSDKNVHIMELGIRRRTVSDCSDGSVTEDEIEGAGISNLKAKSPVVNSCNKELEIERNGEEEIEWNFCNVLETFEDVRFYISNSLNKEESSRIQSYLSEEKAIIMEKLSTKVQYFITDKEEEADEVKKLFISPTSVRPCWIWDSKKVHHPLPTVYCSW
uniref:BRCT domain-containing protein n=2 Tax=Clastoptera arizonana TaxID=38151 RepID=A0A1B6C320_9HEMI